MKLNPASRKRIDARMVFDFDPTGSSIEVAIDGAWFPASWQAAPVQTGQTWTQTARTTAYFTGTAAIAAGATVLAAGRRATLTRVTLGGDVTVTDSTPIDVE